MVSDENTKKPDSGPDKNPESNAESSTENNTESTVELDEDLLADVEQILNEEDPEFLNQLGDINIDPAAVNLSATDSILSSSGRSGLLSLFDRMTDFKSNTKSVLTFWIFFILALAISKIIWTYKGSILQQNLFLNSFAELGTDLKEFNPSTEVESFYDNIHFTKNLITISVMHANLKPSENSGNNPMLAIEVTTEGLSSDAIIEVKDREAEFKDMLLRHTEEKTYDELTEAEGKRILCEQYRDLINAQLTRGQVRRVLLKSFVIKP